MPLPNRTRGLLAAAAIVVVWSTPALFMHWLTRYYDVYSQNFYRYLVGTLAVIPLALWQMKSRPRLSWRIALLCLIPAIPNVAHQLTQTAAVTTLQPGFYSVLARLNVFFTAILALLFFADERQIVRNPRFIFGTTLGIAGAIGIVAMRPGFSLTGTDANSILMAVLAALTWGLYSVLVKRFASGLDPFTGFSLIGALTTLLILPLAIAKGDLMRPLNVGWWPNAVLVFSGVFCIGLGHALFYITIRDLGVSVSQNIQLLCPLGAVLLSSALFGEHLSVAQLACGLVLLAGAFLTVSIDRRVAPEEDF